MVGAADSRAVIEVDDLKMWFPVREGFFASLIGRGDERFVRAVDGVSFKIHEGEIFGLVGESGSGKTTVGMTTLRLYQPTAGSIRFLGQDVTHVRGDGLRSFRRGAQIVFQNPYESLNARFTVYDAVAEPLRLHSIGSEEERRARVIEALERAELYPAESFLWDYPHELSGGQRQRVAIARAIVLEPAFLVADEPVSMLDVSIRAGVLNLLRRLSEDLGMSILYISHDITTVRYICGRMATMYAGKLIELGDSETIIRHPLHPYTQLLIQAIPRMDKGEKRDRVLLKGEVPDLVQPPSGCRFHPRCPAVMEICDRKIPPLREAESGHWVACHLY